jgi:hypothetical protein
MDRAREVVRGRTRGWSRIRRLYHLPSSRTRSRTVDRCLLTHHHVGAERNTPKATRSKHSTCHTIQLCRILRSVSKLPCWRTVCQTCGTHARNFCVQARISTMFCNAAFGYLRRDLCEREGWSTELFGDYHPGTMLIRVWMRTAIRREVTSFGTFLSTLCHEFCHHLDFQLFRFSDSWHTRGFYERAAALYHHARGTPRKRLFWVPMPGGRWRIDWQRTARGR